MRLVRQDHRGLVATLNAGLAACRGEYVARHDADDIAFPERLAAQVRRLESEESLAAVGCLVEGFPPGDVREAGAVVSDVFSVFFYGIYQESPQIFADAKLTLHYLATWQDVLAEARARNLFSDATFAEVKKFLGQPAEWSRDHGGAFERAKAAG